MTAKDASPGWIAPLAAVAQALRFYSRLPVPRLPFETDPHALPDFTRHAWAIPVAGLIIGMTGAVAGASAMLAGLSPMISAAVTLAVLVIATGCFHEDGLADSCDGLWGGMTVERRLEIMKDSRIGSYGAAALALSLLIRFAALAELFRLMGPYAAILMPPLGAITRAAALVPAVLLEPARSEGLGKIAPRPVPGGVLVALAVGCLALGGAIWLLDLLNALMIAPIPLVVAVAIAISVMRRKIGGYTGDMLGATQQLSEIALLLALCSAAAARGPF